MGGFMPLPSSKASRAMSKAKSMLKSSPSDGERMKKILQEEALNKENMAATANQLKKMKPEVESMNPMQSSALKALGMDPSMIKKSMEMMRDNPSMMSNMGKMMETMTPEQMMAKSREAQEKMAGFSPELVEKASKTLDASQVEAATKLFADAEDSSENNDEDEDLKKIVGDPEVLDKMYDVAQLMSQPPSDGVTFYGFASLPPIVLLSGDREMDLSTKELKECWAEGSGDSSQVDREGFERVWNEVQDYFEGDIMEEARKTSIKRASTQPVKQTPTVGANLTPDQMEAVNKGVKEMSDQDMVQMLKQMSEITPEQEARMKAMGVDPKMMQKQAKMMQDNPMMRKAASAFMKNLSPEQMRKMSEQTQSNLASM